MYRVRKDLFPVVGSDLDFQLTVPTSDGTGLEDLTSATFVSEVRSRIQSSDTLVCSLSVEAGEEEGILECLLSLANIANLDPNVVYYYDIIAEVDGVKIYVCFGTIQRFSTVSAI